MLSSFVTVNFEEEKLMHALLGQRAGFQATKCLERGDVGNFYGNEDN